MVRCDFALHLVGARIARPTHPRGRPMAAPTMRRNVRLHPVGVDALIDPSAKRHKGRRADVGIRPYEIPGSVGVGVDALIDPSAKRPGMREK